MARKKITHIVFDHDGTLVDTSGLDRVLYIGMKDLLKELRGQGIKLYIWTARGRKSTLEIIDEVGISSFFEELSCQGESSSKPSPEGIKHILYDVDPACVCVIGDSSGDMVGSKLYGSYGIGALWGHGTDRGRQVMMNSGADICCESVVECTKLLRELIKIDKI